MNWYKYIVGLLSNISCPEGGINEKEGGQFNRFTRAKIKNWNCAKDNAPTVKVGGEAARHLCSALCNILCDKNLQTSKQDKKYVLLCRQPDIII